MNVYLHEIIRTVPGQEEAYMASVLSLQFVPGRGEKTGGRMAQFAQLRAAETSGAWPLVVNIWEHSWEIQTAHLERQFQDRERDVEMEQWWNRNLHLRRGGYDRILLPADYAPDGAALREAGVKGRVFLHEIAWLPFGEPPRYLDALGRDLVPAARRCGWELIGAWRVAMRPRQVVTLLCAREWDALGRLFEARHSDPTLAAWFDYRDRTVQDAQELVLLPGRHDFLSLR